MKLLKKIVSFVLTAAIIYESALFTSIAVHAAENREEQYHSEIISNLAAYNDDAELEETGWYVSDVMMAYGGSLEDAEQAIRAKGYLPYPQNTNDTGAGLVTCIGYKLTRNKNEAITSLAVMNQHGGYQEFDYESFLEDRIPGLADIVNGMMVACKTMRENVKGGNEAAWYALQYLNLYHVPGDDADTPALRAPLGDYLLDEGRTYDDYKKIILVSNASVLSFINGHLGAGCNDSYVPSEQKLLVGGARENQTWLRDAFDAVLNNPYLFCIDDDEINEYWLYLMDHCYSDAILLIKNLENSILSEKAESYLSAIRNESGDNGKPKKIAGDTYTDLLDFLRRADLDDTISARLLYAFVNALPQGLSTQYFVDIVNLYCEKGDGTLPAYYTKTPSVESNWMMNAMNALRASDYDPEKSVWVEKQLKTCAGYRDKVELFVSMIEDFVVDYDNACIAFGDVCGVYPDEISEEDAEMALEEARMLIEEGVDISEETLADDLAVMSAYTQLAQYSIVTENTVLDGYQLPPGYVSWEQVDVPEENEPKNLGEYLLLIADFVGADEAKTADAKIALASVLYNAMNEAQHYNVSSCGLVHFFNFAGFGGVGLEKYKELLEVEGKKFSDAVLDEIGTPTLSVFYGTHEDLLRVDNLYQTNRSLRADAVNEALMNSMARKQEQETLSAHLTLCSEAISAASMAAGLASSIIAMSVDVSFTGMFSAIGSVAGNLILSSGSVAAITSSMVGAAVAGVFFIASIVLMVAFLVILILTLIPPSEPDIEFTPIPETMVDLPENKSNLVRYDVVRDQDGNPADFNKDSKRQWLALYYSKDKTVGSPLMANSESDPGFIVKYADMSVPEKHVPLGKFGETVAFNLNSDQKVDKTGGIYLFYTTVNSANDIASPESSGKYLSGLKLGISTYEETAKNAVRNEAGYTLLDVNLTPNSGAYCGTQYYTYIGYSTTDSASKAITDIRAAYSTDAYRLTFGDGDYYNVYSEKEVSCPLKTSATSSIYEESTPFYYQLYYSRSATAGDPILADSLRVITNLSDLRTNEEYARCFSGEAFDPQAEMGCLIANPKPVGIGDNPILDPEHHFLAYSDEKSADFDGSKQYLAGISFFFGTRFMDVTYHNTYGSRLTYWEQSLLNREAKLFGVTLLDQDLTPVDGDYTEVFRDNHGQADHTYMGYSTTNNPKKAITSIGVFVGEPGPNDHRQYPANINNNGYGYGVSDVYVIRSDSEKITLRYTNGFISPSLNEFDYPDYWMGDKTFQRGRALYVAGPTANTNYAPILLSEVILAKTPNDLPLTSGENAGFTRLTGEKVNGALPSNYRSVHALVEKYHDVYDAVGQLLTPGTNLGFNHPDYDSSLYIYYRSGEKKIERGTYVSKVEIVGDSGGNSSIETAMLYGLTYGDEIIGLDDPLGIDETYAYHVDDSPIFDGDGGTMHWTWWSLFSNWGWYDYNNSAVYLSVSYSNREEDALGTVIVSTNPKGAELPRTKDVVMDCNGTVTTCSKGAFTCPAGYASGYGYYGARNTTYTVYTSKNGTPIGRIEIVRGNEVELELNGRGFRYLTDENGKIFDPYDDGTNGARQAVICIDAKRAEYIESIIAFDDMETRSAWNELMKKGYQEIIATDALAGLGTGRVHFAIKRTSTSLDAIKNILCAPQNYGETFAYDGRNYQRINDFSISRGVPLASQEVFLYTTKGNDDDNSGSKPVYLALRNLGVLVESDRSRVVYWNGDGGKSVLGLSDQSTVLTTNGESRNVTVLTTTNVGGSLGTLDGGAFDRQNVYLEQYYKGQYEEFRKDAGNAKLVFTNLAGKKMEDYGKGQTGAISILGSNGIAVIILSSVFAIAVGGVLLITYKRRKVRSKKANNI